MDRPVELLADDGVENDGAGTQFLLHLRVIREIDADDLISRIGVTAAIEHVAGEDVGLGARDENAVGRVAGQHFLQFRHAGGEGVEFLGALEVLQEDIGAVGRLRPVKRIVRRLDGADDKVHLAVVHLQPGLVAVVIVIGHEPLDHLQQIMPHALLDGDVGGPPEIFRDPVDGPGIGLVVPDGLETAVRIPLHEGIRAVLVRILPGLEFRRGHVRGIETGPVRPAAVARKEGLPVDPVPGAVVDRGVQSLPGIRQGAQEGLPVAEILLPIDFVHLVGGHPVQPQDLLPVVGDPRQVRSGDGHLGIILHKPVRIGAVPGTGNRRQSEEQPDH